MENKGESDHFLEVPEDLEILEILEVLDSSSEKTPFVMTSGPLRGPDKDYRRNPQETTDWGPSPLA